MSRTALSGATVTTEREQAIQAYRLPKLPLKQHQRQAWRFAIRISPLLMCLLITLTLRIWLTVRTHGVIDGDEAMVGIQAEHILRGERPFPFYFYGQAYMGSLEAYLTAILFKIAGPSVWALRAEPTLLSLVLVWLTGRMAAALANAAHLPVRATSIFTTTAMLFAAVAPVYDTVLAMRTLGGYIETFILMLFLLLSAFRLTQRCQEEVLRKELALRWAGIGFIIGLGLWVDPLIASAIVTATLWIAGYFITVVVRQKNVRAHIRYLFLAVATIPGFFVGVSPAIWWGMRNHWANLIYLLQLGNQPQNAVLQQQYPTHLDVLRGMVWFYSKVMIPRLVGGALPGEDALSSLLHTITTITGMLCICITLVLFICSAFNRRPQWRRIRHLVALPLLFALCEVVLFCTSPISSVGLISLQHDLAGRYATPLMLALPFFFATTITAIVLWYESRHSRDGGSLDVGGGPSRASIFSPTDVGGGPSRASVHLKSFHFFRGGRDKSVPTVAHPVRGAIAGTGAAGGRDKSVPTVAHPVRGAIAGTGAAGGRDTSVPTVALGIVFALLLITLGLQAASYGMVDPATTFQSTSCPMAPANDDPIIAYLQQEHVRYAWAIPWIGNPITFKTNDGIITADPRPVINFMGLTRITAYLRDVSLANRPALLAFVAHGDANPLLLRILDEKHITYRAAYFPSEPGIDVLVVTRLSRTLSLYASPYLRDVFRPCI